MLAGITAKAMSMKKLIVSKLKDVEKQHNVRILYACESGSRSWGFPSPDSDYDVRFIYARPQKDYIRINEKRDVIELPIEGDLDINGWDIKKALYLFTRSNGALLEWLQSPIVYLERDKRLREELLRLSKSSINLTALCYHYSHMARGNAREYLQGNEVRIKKYFYVLRPLFAIRYILENRTIPPVDFRKLASASAPLALTGDLQDLLERKAVTNELGVGPAYPRLNAFIERELERTEFSGQGRPLNNTEELNKLFRKLI